MKKILQKISTGLLITSLIFQNETMAFASSSIPEKDCAFTPTVLTNQITHRTDEIRVYVYDDTALYIENGDGIVYQKFYASEGIKKIQIKKQSAGSTLKFYLKAKESGKAGSIITKKVKNLRRFLQKP